VQLPAQQVEVVGRRGDVGDLPVGALDLASEVAADGPLGVVDVLFFFFSIGRVFEKKKKKS
jgi:hypothetical protein